MLRLYIAGSIPTIEQKMSKSMKKAMRKNKVEMNYEAIAMKMLLSGKLF